MKQYQAAKGSFWQNYIGEVGEWVDVSKLKYYWLKIKGYKVRIMIPEIDEEWSEFLQNLPENNLPIEKSNKNFELLKKKWYVKMSIKYGFDVEYLKSKYETDY